MAMAVRMVKLPNRGRQNVFAVTALERPGQFKPFSPMFSGADMTPPEPPQGTRGWFPEGVDYRTHTFNPKK